MNDLTPSDVLSVSSDVRISATPFARVVRTRHGSIEAITAIHRQRWRRRIGGARFVERGSLEEVAHLSSCMTEKCGAARLPADGEKSIVVCPDGVPTSFEERARILAEHVSLLRRVDPGVIVGPDMNVSEEVQDRVAAVPGLLGHVTGLSVGAGGLAIDAHGYTARGLAAAMRVLVEAGRVQPGRVTIQGFGAVGAHLALLLVEVGWRVVGVSDVHGALVTDDDRGLDIPALHARWLATGGLRGEVPPGATWWPAPGALFEVPTDLFVPAARTTVLAREDELAEARGENGDVVAIERFLDDTGARVVLQGANHPLSEAAERFAEARGVLSLPDFAVNLGGLVGCWVEWAYRDALRGGDTLARARLEPFALRWITGAVEANVRELLRRGGSARDAARALAREADDALWARCAHDLGDPEGYTLARRLLEDR